MGREDEAPPWSTVLLAHIAFVYGHDTIRLAEEGSRISSALIASTARSGFAAATEVPGPERRRSVAGLVEGVTSRGATGTVEDGVRIPGQFAARATSALAPIVSAAPTTPAPRSVIPGSRQGSEGRLCGREQVRPVSPPTITIMSASPRASRSPSSPTKAIGVLPARW